MFMCMMWLFVVTQYEMWLLASDWLAAPAICDIGNDIASVLQACGVGAQAILDGWSRSLKFGSQFHGPSSWSKRVVQII